MEAQSPPDPANAPTPKSPRRRPARERLLASADRLLYEQGLGASGIDQIISEAGVAKGSLYANFPSKDDLIDAYLSTRHRRTMEEFSRIDALNERLDEKIDAIFDYLLSQTREDAFRGCAFVIAAAETSDRDGMPMRWAQVNKRALYDWLFGLCSTAGLQEPSTVANQISILYDGALVTSALRPESDAVKVARQMAHALVK